MGYSLGRRKLEDRYLWDSILALRFATATYALLRETGVPPEYGITPLFDPNNLIPSEQTTLSEWTGDA